MNLKSTTLSLLLALLASSSRVQAADGADSNHGNGDAILLRGQEGGNRRANRRLAKPPKTTPNPTPPPSPAPKGVCTDVFRRRKLKKPTPPPVEAPVPSPAPTQPPTSPPQCADADGPCADASECCSGLECVVGPTPTTYPVATAADISEAMSTAQPGDVLAMSTLSVWTDADIVFIGDGMAAAPITLTSDTPGEPVLLNGSSRLRFSGSHLVVDGLRFEKGALSTANDQVIQFRTGSSDLCSHCRLTNSAIIDYNPMSSSLDYRWVGIYGTNNIVDHNYFSGKNHKGALLIVWRRTDDTPDFHVIENNYFGDFESGDGENGWETVRIGTSTNSLSDSSTIVSRNLFERCDGEIEIISVKSGDNVLSGNTFDSCAGMLTLRHGRGNTVDGNFFLGRGVNDSGGVRVIDSDHVVVNNYFEGLRGTSSRAAIVLANGLVDSAINGYFAADRTTVAFNTVYDCKEALRIGWRSSSNTIPVTDSTVANNAVYSTSGSGASTIITEEDALVNMVYEGNIMFGDGVPLGLSPDPSEINETDPILVLSAGGMYRPGVGSPCVNGATAGYDSVVADMDGQPRPTGVARDVGADEVSSDLVTSGPLSNADVGGAIGPSWWL